MRPSHVVINVLRKPILSGPLESGIGTVPDMSEITTENKVYSHHPQCVTKDFITDEVLYKVFKKQ